MRNAGTSLPIKVVALVVLSILAPPPLEGIILAQSASSPTTIQDSPPTSADLAQTIDAQINSNITRLAVNTLGGDPLRIFLYVRNNFHFEPYGGSIKGAFQTLADGGGNDYDLSSLTVALLRAAGIPARYVTANVTLSGNATENWLGVQKPSVAASIFATAGRPYRWTYYANGSTAFNFAEVMVSAYIKNAWMLMDPSFKQQILTQAENMSTIMGVNVNSLTGALSSGLSSGNNWFTSVSLNSILAESNYTTGNLLSYVKANPNMDLRDLVGGDTIVAASSYTSPSRYTVISTYDEIPAQERHTITISFPVFDNSNKSYDWLSNASLTIPTPSLGQRRVSISFVPLNSSVTSYVAGLPGGLFDPGIDPAKVLMYPELRINGSFFLAGQPGPAGSPMSVQVTYRAPLDSQVRTVKFTPYVGGYYNLVVDFGPKFKWNDLTSRINEEVSTVKTALGGTSVDIDLLLGELLYDQGQTYFNNAKFFDAQLASLLGIVQLSNPSVALTGYDVRQENDNPSGGPLLYGGMMMDVQLNGAYPGFSGTNNTRLVFAYDFLRGLLGSEAEGNTLAMLYQNAPVSTTEVLQTADETGVPIYTLDKTNYQQLLPTLEIRQATKDAISSFISQGLVVFVPEHIISLNVLTINISSSAPSIAPLRTWTGIAYMTLNPRFGDTGMYIQQGSLTGSAQPSPIRGGGQAEQSGPTVDQQQSFATLDLTEKAAGWIGYSADVANALGATAVGFAHSTGVWTDFSLAGAALKIGSEEVQGLSEAFSLASATMHFSEDYQAIMNSDPTFSTPFRDLTSATIAATYAFSEYAIPAAITTAAIPLAVTSAVGGGPLGIAGAVALMGAVGWTNYEWGNFMTQSRKLNLVSFNACSNAYRVCSDPPFLNMNLQDPGGAISGANPLTDTTALRIQGSIAYSGAGTLPQVLQILDPARGTYLLSLQGTESPSADYYIGVGLSAGLNHSTAQQVQGTIEDGQTIRLDLVVSVDSKGDTSVSLSQPLPASFITLAASTASGGQVSITGNLDGSTGANALVGKSIGISYRPAGDFVGGWNPIATVTTDSNGAFSETWTPPSAGTYDLNASYVGDSNTFGAFGLVYVGNGVAPIPTPGFPYWLLLIAVVAAAAALGFVFFGRGRLLMKAPQQKIKPIKYCRYCGKPTSKEAAFCKNCGRSFRKPDAEELPGRRGV